MMLEQGDEFLVAVVSIIYGEDLCWRYELLELCVGISSQKS